MVLSTFRCMDGGLLVDRVLAVDMRVVCPANAKTDAPYMLGILGVLLWVIGPICLEFGLKCYYRVPQLAHKKQAAVVLDSFLGDCIALAISEGRDVCGLQLGMDLEEMTREQLELINSVSISVADREDVLAEDVSFANVLSATIEEVYRSAVQASRSPPAQTLVSRERRRLSCQWQEAMVSHSDDRDPSRHDTDLQSLRKMVKDKMHLAFETELLATPVDCWARSGGIEGEERALQVLGLFLHAFEPRFWW